MKVKDLIAINTADTWITFDEDPNIGEPNIVVRSHSRVDESEMLAKELLEAEVHLMCARKGAVYISVWEYGN